jgi:hypothetical protein
LGTWIKWLHEARWATFFSLIHCITQNIDCVSPTCLRHAPDAPTSAWASHPRDPPPVDCIQGDRDRQNEDFGEVMNTASPYTECEASTLRTFRAICDEIVSCRFVRDLPRQKHIFSVRHLPDGTSCSQYPEYDKDDFLAFLTHYRKLVATKEATNIFSVLNIIGRYANETDRTRIKTVRKNLTSASKTPPLQIAIGAPGNETPYPPHKIGNIIFNGQVFHSDKQLQDDLRKMLEFDPIAKMVFLTYATLLVSQACQISHWLKDQGHV